MGVNESTLKLMTDPVNNLITNCGHSDCKSKCGNCFELEIDTTPTLQPREPTHDSGSAAAKADSMQSNVTKIVDPRDV